ncbi:MKRN2 opposite strand protein [Myiozetetes cayanensis]|uniref:MKRN2 opposite strand protein n=1 Tax=Myiozetetes cayanensis TaxID=478635 RepID=UPI0021604E5A|nr:MKRN2 opposite strand protein [Myiozetetes cayanensis]
MALLRVRHCRALLYCRRAPARCPACGGALAAGGLSSAPVRLDCPFRPGHGQPRAFLVRPTRGAFLRGYDGSSDLHVGITDSRGVVYHYDQEGVHRAHCGWEQCICIPLVQPQSGQLLHHWDGLLEEFAEGEAWLPHRYDEQEHNCYTFALAFINHVLSRQGKQPLSKEEFTERFVLPQSRRASRYLSLQRELAHRDCYIVPLPPGGQSSGAEHDQLLQ